VCVFCVFLKNDKTDVRPIFLVFRRKHLFITTCIEKQCTRPLTALMTLFMKREKDDLTAFLFNYNYTLNFFDCIYNYNDF